MPPPLNTRRQRRRDREEREAEREDRIQQSLNMGNDRNFMRGVQTLMNEGADGYGNRHQNYWAHWLSSRWGKGSTSTKTRERFYLLAQMINRKAKNLITHKHIEALWAVAGRPWVRKVETWKIKGKSPNSRFRSLAGHLLMKYKTPQFLYSTFDTANDPWLPLALLIGNGGSLKVAQVHLPVRFTKRMWHMFLMSPNTCEVLEAIRTTQVKIAGGDQRVVAAILKSRIGTTIGARGRGDVPLALIPEIEEFWNTFIMWVSRQGMLDPNLIEPLFDYLSHCRLTRDQENVRDGTPERGPWELKGRTVASVLRGMEEWHGDLVKIKRLHGLVYLPSGYAIGMWETKPNWSPIPVLWTMEEILTSKRLLQEGKALNHCVYSYGPSIHAGDISIWSLMMDDAPRITVEVNNRRGRIVQARGHNNHSPAHHEWNFITRWARDNGVAVAA